jgi:hypothetical protein
MAKRRSAANPFYALVAVAGVLFFITACSYGLMTLRADHQGRVLESRDTQGSLLDLVEFHGVKLLAGELLLLATATVAAVSLDQFRSRRHDL